ncbi:MAG: glycosyltransferase family 2 protein [Actinobacteria bacterium]|nr:glycosyltransferase family 2 protein [Actinomycetota bacterium]MBU1945022.1 glycosyltransferase family 2 protein [Actinomycetota bacterium]MBU2686642.1 glycosyltransferase family 2 protein [Actinomycetota bacterium]
MQEDPGYDWSDKRRKLYIPVKAKFIIATVFASTWFLFSLWISEPWIESLSKEVGEPLGFLIILFVALIPGFLMSHLLFSILLDRPPALDLDIDYPPVTILMAAYNEADNIGHTFEAVRCLDYPGEIHIVVVDDGSTDDTLRVLGSLDLPGLEVIAAEHGGKAHALNIGLEKVSTSIFLTIDADTVLHPQALKRLIARFVSDPCNTAAVAGSVISGNPGECLITKMQEWDYYAAISSVKRQQSLFQGALVAQGALSAYHTVLVRGERGWPSVVGEDIVLTWAFLKDGWRVGYETTAVGFTITPQTLKGFYRQRKRWARGMIEGLKRHGDIVWERPHLPAFFVAVDFLFPFLDTFYTFAYIPGIILALFGKFYIVGPLTLLVLPLTFLVVGVMSYKEHKVMKLLGIEHKRSHLGLVFFMLFYQLIMSPTCVVGYVQEIFGAKKSW